MANETQEHKNYLTSDLKRAIEEMEKEGLPLDAPLEIHIDDETYYVKSVAHFHIEPNMVISLHLKTD